MANKDKTPPTDEKPDNEPTPETEAASADAGDEAEASVDETTGATDADETIEAEIVDGDTPVEEPVAEADDEAAGADGDGGAEAEDTAAANDNKGTGGLMGPFAIILGALAVVAVLMIFLNRNEDASASSGGTADGDIAQPISRDPLGRDAGDGSAASASDPLAAVADDAAEQASATPATDNGEAAVDAAMAARDEAIGGGDIVDVIAQMSGIPGQVADNVEDGTAEMLAHSDGESTVALDAAAAALTETGEAGEVNRGAGEEMAAADPDAPAEEASPDEVNAPEEEAADPAESDAVAENDDATSEELTDTAADVAEAELSTDGTEATEEDTSTETEVADVSDQPAADENVTAAFDDTSSMMAEADGAAQASSDEGSTSTDATEEATGVAPEVADAAVDEVVEEEAAAVEEVVADAPQDEAIEVTATEEASTDEATEEVTEETSVAAVPMMTPTAPVVAPMAPTPAAAAAATTTAAVASSEEVAEAIRPMLSDFKADVTEEVLAEVEAVINPALEETNELVSTLRDELDEQTSLQRENNERLADLTSRLETIQTGDISQTRRTALALALADLREGIDSGNPFMTELETVAEIIPNSRSLAELRDFASDGLPSNSALSQQYGELARKAVSAAGRDTDKETAGGRLSANVSDLFTVRPLGQTADDTPAGVIATAEAQLSANDLAGAVATLEALEGPAAEVFSDWIAQAKAKLGARANIDRLQETLAEGRAG